MWKKIYRSEYFSKALYLVKTVQQQIKANITDMAMEGVSGFSPEDASWQQRKVFL